MCSLGPLFLYPKLISVMSLFSPKFSVLMVGPPPTTCCGMEIKPSSLSLYLPKGEIGPVWFTDVITSANET